MTERFLVSGRVQGVGFRWWVLHQATGLGLGGWVRNLADGNVEVVASGGEEARDRLADLLQQGPRSAVVSHVERHVIQDELDSSNKFVIK